MLTAPLLLLLLPCPVAAAAVLKLANPKEFFTACYHSLLCCTDTAATEAAASTSADSSGSSGATTQPSSSSSDKITQQLCVKAMAAAYSAHAGTIGPFEGIPHLLQLMDTTQQRSLRHGLLLLLHALVAPKAAGDLSGLNAPLAAAGKSSFPNVAGSKAPAALSVNTASKGAAAAAAAGAGGRGVKLSQLPPAQAASVTAAKANGYLLMDHGGLQLLVDFVAGAHECTERRMAAAAAGAAGAAAAGAGHLITSISHAEVR
jgi:DnaJ family protein C protein 13